MRLTKQFSVSGEDLDPAFLYDFMAVGIKHLYDRYRAALDAQAFQPMPPGQFANTLLALGIHTVRMRYTVPCGSVTFSDVFPDQAMEAPIAALHDVYRKTDHARYPVMDMLSFKNWLMVNGISEMCKELIEAEKKLGISQ